ncbi:MAG: nitroreductase [Gammaproteobacteria bacterium]|nr:nitroreductase [Gammaproteobacteria bacterium]
MSRDTAQQLADRGLAEFGERLKRRRTISDFKALPVPGELLLQAIEVARWAPNHRLTEPWHFYLLGADTVDRLLDLIVAIKVADKGEPARAALLRRLDRVPGWFAVTCKRNADAWKEREDYAACCCAVQNMVSYLWQGGVGVKWTTGAVTRDERCAALFGIDPATEFIVGLFQYGYPERVPEQQRREVRAICTQLD